MKCPECECELERTKHNRSKMKCPRCSEAKATLVMWSYEFLDGFEYAAKKVADGIVLRI
jgi:hypothetical protein